MYGCDLDHGVHELSGFRPFCFFFRKLGHCLCCFALLHKEITVFRIDARRYIAFRFLCFFDDALELFEMFRRIGWIFVIAIQGAVVISPFVFLVGCCASRHQNEGRKSGRYILNSHLLASRIDSARSAFAVADECLFGMYGFPAALDIDLVHAFFDDQHLWVAIELRGRAHGQSIDDQYRVRRRSLNRQLRTRRAGFNRGFRHGAGCQQKRQRDCYASFHAYSLASVINTVRPAPALAVPEINSATAPSLLSLSPNTLATRALPIGVGGRVMAKPVCALFTVSPCFMMVSMSPGFNPCRMPPEMNSCLPSAFRISVRQGRSSSLAIKAFCTSEMAAPMALSFSVPS